MPKYQKSVVGEQEGYQRGGAGGGGQGSHPLLQVSGKAPRLFAVVLLSSSPFSPKLA
jgi:hypothetical protein